MPKAQSIVRRPIVTEKSTILREILNKYTFEVNSKANKIEIKKAVEELFDVTVQDVRTMNKKGKIKRMLRKRGAFTGKKRDWKKAIVTLKEGDHIDVVQGV